MERRAGLLDPSETAEASAQRQCAPRLRPGCLGMAEVVTDHPQRQRPGRQAPRDRVELDVSTPLAKTVVDTLLAAPGFDRAGFTLHVRPPQALVAAERMITLIRPLIEPTSESFQELEPFSYLTFGWVGRLFRRGIRLALGMLLS